MYTASQAAKMIAQWKVEELSRPEIVIKAAEACLGWPYVWGAAGQYCTPAYRKQFAARSSCPEAESKVILSKCQVCSGKKSSCDGCKWYPGGQTRIFDCRGFTRWILGQVNVTLDGAGATSQWNAKSNWVAKGEIDTIPKDKVCVLFWKDKQKAGVMGHTGLYLGDNQIIHCSGEVKRDTLATKGWTHWAMPKNLYEGDIPVPDPTNPTLRKGNSGEYVTLLQTKLIQLGYDLSPYGADGKFGNKTLEAVKQFQKDRGLEADGVVGSKTWEALLSGEVVLYTVRVEHLSKSVADEIVSKYGGTMTKEGE